MNLPAPILSPPSRLAPSLARSPTDLERSRDLARIKIIATTLLVFSVVVAFAARLLESRHWSLGYVAAWAEAAAVGGLADWYAVVALFRHPCGIPLPHTAIISNNRERIAESFGDFVEEQFLAPDPIEQKLKSVDFAEAAADWLADEERSLSLSRFALRLMPQALSAVEETGLQSFMARHVVEQIEALEVAPLAAKLMSAFVEDQRHQRIFDEVLVGLDRLLRDEQTLEAVREKIRGEMPSLFSLFRADAYVLRRLVALISNFIHEAQGDPDHPLRHDFDRFVQGFRRKARLLAGIRRQGGDAEARIAGSPRDQGSRGGSLAERQALPREGRAERELNSGIPSRVAFSPTSAASSPTSRGCEPKSTPAW